MLPAAKVVLGFLDVTFPQEEELTMETDTEGAAERVALYNERPLPRPTPISGAGAPDFAVWQGRSRCGVGQGARPSLREERS